MDLSQKKQRAKDFYQQNEQKIAVGFFIGGFLFDLITLDRIDSWFMIGQQFIYLALILIILLQLFFEQGQTNIKNRFYSDYRIAIVHFLFGNLLNLYTLFFFKSSSLLVSFGFLAFIVALLIANESARFKNLGLAFKFAMLSLCLLAFFSYLVPIFIGSINTLVFLFSMLIGSLPLIAIVWYVQHYKPTYLGRAKSQIFLPLGSVLASFLILYFLKWIPPVPLSIPFIGVYHGVEKTVAPTTNETLYKLAHERPWWKIWQTGDQEFLAQRADKIYVAFRIFSPAHFSDRVNLRWFWYDNNVGWVAQDNIPIKIVGGRESGFRGFGVKSNYQPGHWRVQVETTDEREIGRIQFHLEIAPEEPRVFEYDQM